MKRISFLLSCFVFAPLVVFAYDVTGTIKDEGFGDYLVAVEDVYGHVYVGAAQQEGANYLNVRVINAGKQSYSGSAIDNEDGTYDLTLKSDYSDDESTGTLAKVY